MHGSCMMRFHGQGETRVHSGGLGRVELVGDNDNGGDNDARSRNSASSKGSSGKGVGRPRKARRTGPLSSMSLLSPPMPKWRIGCSNSRPSPSGNSGQWWQRRRFCS